MGSIYRRGKIYWIKYYHKGEPQRESSESRKYKDAKELLAIREGDKARSKLSAITGKIRFSELLNDLMRDYQLNNRKSIKNVFWLMDAHLMPFFGDLMYHEVTGDTLNQYAWMRKDEGVSNSAIRNELAIVLRACNFAAERGKVDFVPKFKRPKPDPPRTDEFTDKEFKELQGESIYYVAAITHFAIRSGWRLKEIIRLKWSEVSFERNEIRILPGQSKNDQLREMVMTPEIRALIERQYKSTQRSKHPDCLYVFNRNGHQIKSFRTAWENALERAKLKGHTFHGFRRTMRRKLDDAGVDERIGMAIMGHKTRQVYDDYRTVKRSDLEAAAKKLSTRRRHSK